MIGSSPRVRGKPAWATRAGVHSGLIPACAGKTLGKLAISPRNGAHPRVCGENYIPRSEWPEPMGSSPRVRGKRQAGGVHGTDGGLIPACAGKTLNDLEF